MWRSGEGIFSGILMDLFENSWLGFMSSIHSCPVVSFDFTWALFVYVARDLFTASGTPPLHHSILSLHALEDIRALYVLLFLPHQVWVRGPRKGSLFSIFLDMINFRYKVIQDKEVNCTSLSSPEMVISWWRTSFCKTLMSFKKKTSSVETEGGPERGC